MPRVLLDVNFVVVVRVFVDDAVRRLITVRRLFGFASWGAERISSSGPSVCLSVARCRQRNANSGREAGQKSSNLRVCCYLVQSTLGPRIYCSSSFVSLAYYFRAISRSLATYTHHCDPTTTTSACCSFISEFVVGQLVWVLLQLY